MSNWHSEVGKIGNLESPESLTWERVRSNGGERPKARIAARGAHVFITGALVAVGMLAGVAVGASIRAPDGSNTAKTLVNDGDGWNQYVWQSDEGFVCTQFIGDAPGASEGFGCGLPDPGQPFWTVVRHDGVLGGILYPRSELSASADGVDLTIQTETCPCESFESNGVVFSIVIPKGVASQHADDDGLVWVTLDVHQSGHAPTGTSWATLQIAMETTVENSNT